jgi:hypothetical protein
MKATALKGSVCSLLLARVRQHFNPSIIQISVHRLLSRSSSVMLSRETGRSFTIQEKYWLAA